MMTDDQRCRLSILAGAIAFEAPIRESSGMTARIPWGLVNKIRAILDEAGFDWKEECRKVQMVRRHDWWKKHGAVYGYKEPPLP